MFLQQMLHSHQSMRNRYCQYHGPVVLVRKLSIIYTLVHKAFASHSDIALFTAHYHTILQLMPDNHEQSVGKLQNYISDDQICMILSSSNSTTANKMILDCLIERMSCKEELLDLCAQLETISTSHQLNMLISEIRSGEQL